MISSRVVKGLDILLFLSVGKKPLIVMCFIDPFFKSIQFYNFFQLLFVFAITGVQHLLQGKGKLY